MCEFCRRISNAASFHRCTLKSCNREYVICNQCARDLKDQCGDCGKLFCKKHNVAHAGCKDSESTDNDEQQHKKRRVEPKVNRGSSFVGNVSNDSPPQLYGPYIPQQIGPFIPQQIGPQIPQQIGPFIPSFSTSFQQSTTYGTLGNKLEHAKESIEYNPYEKQPKTEFTCFFPGYEQEKKFKLVECGAGGGELSAYLSDILPSFEIIATDVVEEETNRGWLLAAKKKRLQVRFGVSANELEKHFEAGSIDIIISAGCYGVGPSKPGASYGLARCTGRWRKTTTEEKKKKKSKNYHQKHNQQNVDEVPETEPDERFLQSAWTVLKPGGRVVLWVRNNMLFDCCNVYEKQSLGLLQQHNDKAARDPHAKLGTTNMYADIKLAALWKLAEDLGYQVMLTPVTPPSGVRFRSIDSNEDKDLGGFNVQIVCIKKTPWSCNYSMKEVPFWEDVPHEVPKPLEPEDERYTLLGFDEIPGDNDCFFHVVAHHLGTEMADVRTRLTMWLAQQLLAPPYNSIEQDQESGLIPIVTAILIGEVQANQVQLQSHNTVTTLQGKYQNLLQTLGGYPPNLVTYLAQLIWTCDDVYTLRTSLELPGRPNVTIWGENVFIPFVVCEVFQRPVRMYAKHGTTLRRIVNAGSQYQADPIEIFYNGDRHFTVIQFKVPPQEFVEEL
jgi:SAM-dependent methyltransferase